MKMNWLRWLLSALLVSAFFFGCGRKPGEKLYHEALTEWNAGNLVRARALLEKSIHRRAGSLENAEAYNRLGVLLWEMGNPKEAVKAFDESCRLKPAQYDVLCNLGVALGSQDDFEASERAFREAALIRPDTPGPLAFTGILYVKNHKWNDAIRNLTRALERTPDEPRLQTALAIAELHTLGSDAALKRLEAVIRKYPDYTPALFNTASIYRYWLKNPAEAKRRFETCLQKAAGTNPLMDLTRAELQAISEHTGEKISFKPPRSPNREEADKNFRKALALHKKNDLTGAIKGYIAAIEADDTHEQAFYNLGLAYYSGNRMELAADAFARAVQINPAFTAARYNNALAEYRLGQSEQARRELEIVLDQQPAYQPAIDLLNRLKKE